MRENRVGLYEDSRFCNGRGAEKRRKATPSYVTDRASSAHISRVRAPFTRQDAMKSVTSSRSREPVYGNVLIER